MHTSHPRSFRIFVILPLLALLFVPSAAAARTLPRPVRGRPELYDIIRHAALRKTAVPNGPVTFPLFPPSSPWNTDVSHLPVHPLSATYLASIGSAAALHPDFGTVWDGAPNGIPYVVVHTGQARYPVSFGYADESDPGPYPIPPDAPVEGGPNGTGDRHVLAVDADAHMLYELYDARFDAAGQRWVAGSGAVWDLDAICVRPDGWTSADAAGLPMLPGLVRYDEVAAGAITHALRFTVPRTQRAYVYPASHYASSSTDLSLPPMGTRLRLKADYDVSGFPREVQVILQALKTYGMIVADNGSAFYLSGAPDPRWNDDALHTLSQVKGSDFEVVDASSLEPTVPVVYAGRALSARVGTPIARSGCFADPAGSAWTGTAVFGDGGTATLALMSDKRFTLSHTYRTAGDYTIVVSVRDASGRTGTARVPVTVTP